MHLKLAFSHSRDRFSVTALHGTDANAHHEAITILYTGEDVFLDLLLETDLEPSTHARIVEAIAAAATSPSSDSCCVDVILTQDQFDILVMGATRNKTAS